MRLTRVHTPTGTAVRRVDGPQLVDLPYPSMSALLADPDWHIAAGGEGKRTSIDAASYATPVDPLKALCVGLNYRSHIIETGKPQPRYPTLFAKFPDTFTGPYDDIRLPVESSQVDWEVELGIVIGRQARNVAIEHALDYVAGYTIINDISMRDWQSRSSQWLQGKNFPATTPVGPVVVTPDEVDHARDLRISCTVNGTTMQVGRTSDLLFDPARLISYISSFTSLSPGDVIATGTPGGTGAGRDPQRFLNVGDVLSSEIEGIGVLTNRIVGA